MYRTGDLVRCARGRHGSTSSAAPTTRSRSAATASSSARSRRRSRPCPACARPWSSRARTRRGDVRLVAYVTAGPARSPSADAARRARGGAARAHGAGALRHARRLPADAEPQGRPQARCRRPARRGAAARRRRLRRRRRTTSSGGSPRSGRASSAWPRSAPTDNFFALGGHSLLAVQAHREIRARARRDAARASPTSSASRRSRRSPRHLDDRPKPEAGGARRRRRWRSARRPGPSRCRGGGRCAPAG